MLVAAVDINCDMGEGFGHWRINDADDAVIMPFVSSASIATGFHAGDPNLMDRTVALATQHGARIGAHPGYRDLQGFGRRKIMSSDEEIVNDILYQVGALSVFCKRHGVTLEYVKPHGALYMEMAENTALSTLFIQAMHKVMPGAPIFCMSGSQTCQVAETAGVPVVREFYADRDYNDTGSIVFVRKNDAPNPSNVAKKVLRACTEGKVRSVNNKDVDVSFESVCVHSDTPGCQDIFSSLHAMLDENSIKITSNKRVT